MTNFIQKSKYKFKVLKLMELPLNILSLVIPIDVHLKKWQALQLSLNTAPCWQKSFSFLRTLLSNKSRQVAQATIDDDDFVRYL